MHILTPIKKRNRNTTPKFKTSKLYGFVRNIAILCWFLYLGFLGLNLSTRPTRERVEFFHIARGQLERRLACISHVLVYMYVVMCGDLRADAMTSTRDDDDRRPRGGIYC